MTPTDPELIAELRKQAGCEGWTIHVRMTYERAANALEAAHQREGGLLFTIAACDAELAKVGARAQQLEVGLKVIRDIAALIAATDEDCWIGKDVVHIVTRIDELLVRADTQEPTP